MKLTSLEPEFIVDATGTIHQGVVLLDGHRTHSIAKSAPPSATTIPLPNKMLLPGFVNVHSHALQRALRGRVELRSYAGQDNFWSWRSLMYRDVNKASLEDIEAIASLAYLEMLKAGFVAVGEFQYLHQDESGTPYAEPSAVSQRLMKAAERVGIRQTMLTCAYERKNYKEKLLKEQRRFAFPSASEFLSFASNLRSSVQSPLLNHGLAIHSTRACSRSWIEEISYSMLAIDVPFHVHASEQKKEVEEAFLEYGLSPVEALHEFGALRDNTTLIHATHLSSRDMDLMARAKVHVGLCPSTERNLGDGLCAIEDLKTRGIPLCIGTDQHVRLDPINELREMEEQERLRLQRRCILAQPGESVAESLVAVGSLHGRRSLGLEEDSADFVAVSLDHTYEAAGPLAALNSYFVAGSHRDVSDVFVNGRQLIKDGSFTGATAEIMIEAKAALTRLSR
jgi:formimidoylglutamate deiminase